MNYEEQDRNVKNSEEKFIDDSEKTVVTPRFDNESIQHARPAVPLSRTASKKGWPIALVLICLVVGTAGGVISGIAIYRMSSDENGSEVSSTRESAKNESDREEKQSASPQPAAPVANAPESSPTPKAKVDADREQELRAATPENERVDNSTASQTPVEERDEKNGKEAQHTEVEAELVRALDEWISATNARDVERQMNFYGQKVDAFYRSRNASRDAVRAEKARLFRQADSVDIHAERPEIRVSPDGRTATMLFRKRYSIESSGRDRRGEVLQELRWRRTDDGRWRIVSERDLRVLR